MLPNARVGASASVAHHVWMWMHSGRNSFRLQMKLGNAGGRKIPPILHSSQFIPLALFPPLPFDHSSNQSLSQPEDEDDEWMDFAKSLSIRSPRGEERGTDRGKVIPSSRSIGPSQRRSREEEMKAENSNWEIEWRTTVSYSSSSWSPVREDIPFANQRIGWDWEREINHSDTVMQVVIHWFYSTLPSFHFSDYFNPIIPLPAICPNFTQQHDFDLIRAISLLLLSHSVRVRKYLIE